jgi:hypothetical protein
MRLSLSLGFGMRPAPVGPVPLRVCCPWFVVGKTIEISSSPVSANGMPAVDL